MTRPNPPLQSLWDSLVNRMVFLEKRHVFRHGELRLHPSELHLLLAVQAEPEANATRLAALLGVTKGAVSQVLKRLEAKGVVLKRVDPAQKNEVTASFTPLGRLALDAFLAEREGSRQRFTQYLDSLPDPEQAVLRRFLAEVSSYLPGEK